MSRFTETTHLHSHSVFGRYDDIGGGVVSSPDACTLPPKRSNSNNTVLLNNEKNKATRWSLYANVALLIVKIVISYLSGSLAFVASAVDSLLDLVSQSIIFCAMSGNVNVDERVWPLGRSRLEPVGIVIVSFVSLGAVAVLWMLKLTFI
jgi:Co/Zn/Cd efflux system component